MTSANPRVVCLSGSLHLESRTERLAIWCTSTLTELGAQVSLFSGLDLDVPHYRPLPAERAEPVRRMVEAIREADGVLLVSPTYHGTVSGVLKNALDYLNDLDTAPRPFLDGRPVGCVAVAAGEQGAASTLATLRTIAHALRGWPTPLGVTAWGQAAEFVNGKPIDERLVGQLRIMLGQVLTMSMLNARRRRRAEQVATVR
ncbi:MAG TPA: NAD(P)H-dependent oxidoreductase [Pseudonocardiaceae bacterium]|jgi:NAD(P)H-dependent FMN reductase|nr:NAD(P)H-dependent oxidoreductase [Pseudonocardiaceae bacterium]